MRRARALAVAALALAACAPPPRAEPPRSDLVGLERAVFDGVNRQRRALGLAALVSDPHIAGLARAHSVDMARGRVGFGHAGFQARAAALAHGAPAYHAAENVSKHHMRPSKVPTDAVTRWMASEHHRRNIVGSFQRSGVGAARDAAGTIYLTQIFVAD